MVQMFLNTRRLVGVGYKGGCDHSCKLFSLIFTRRGISPNAGEEAG
jgi:hypothetical protein